MKTVVLSIFGIICFLISCNEQPKSQNADKKIIYAEANDPELEQARKEAMSSLSYFINSFKTHSGDTTLQFAVKADFIDGKTHEHMWISIDKIENDQFKGYLDNTPELLKNINYRDRVTIAKDQIEDWSIMDLKTRSMEGGYSSEILYKRQH